MNDLLNQHVTRTGFNLTLGKTHIEALTYLADWMDEPYSGVTDRGPSWFVPGIKGCRCRGLVVHTPPPNVGTPEWDALPPYGQRKLSACWSITAAGWMVLGLLEEAGLWIPRVPEGDTDE